MATATYTAVVGLDDAQGVHHAAGTTFVCNVDTSTPPVPVEFDDRANLTAGRMTLVTGGGTGPGPSPQNQTPLTIGTTDGKAYRADTGALVLDPLSVVRGADLGAQITPSGVSANGTLTVSVVSSIGIRANGSVYYDPAGAAPGEAALLQINPTTGAPFAVSLAGAHA